MDFDPNERLNTVELAEKIRNGTIEAGDLDRIFYRAHKIAVEHALKILPASVDYLMKQALTLRNLSTEFYKSNPELVHKKGLVAQLVEQTEAENPGLPYDKILDKVQLTVKSRANDIENIVNRKKPFKISELDKGLGEL